jgi:hypothetical protein
MKLIIGRGPISLRTALFGMALAFAGSVVAASPAHAAAPDDPAIGTHCVVALPGPSDPKCFATYEEARAYVASRAEAGPPKSGPAATRVESAARIASGGVVVIAVLYDWTLWNPIGGTLTLIGLNGNCSSTLVGNDYALSSFSDPRWNNDTSSYLAFSNCWLNLFDLPGFGGTSSGFAGSQATIGVLNNDVSSILVS